MGHQAALSNHGKDGSELEKAHRLCVKHELSVNTVRQKAAGA